MMTHEISTLNFVDVETGDDAVAIVRTVNGSIALCLSLAHDGDIEVVLSPESCDRLIEALRQAMAVAPVATS